MGVDRELYRARIGMFYISRKQRKQQVTFPITIIIIITMFPWRQGRQRKDKATTQVLISVISVIQSRESSYMYKSTTHSRGTQVIVGVELYLPRVVEIFHSSHNDDNLCETSLVDIDRKCGSFKFTKELLVSQGIHPNPGPFTTKLAIHVNWKIGVVIVAGIVILSFAAVYCFKKDKNTNTQGNTKPQETGGEARSFGEVENPQIVSVHVDMVLKLRGYFAPTCKWLWEDLLATMRKHLDYVAIYGSDVTHVGVIFEKLMAKGTISYGYYDNIVEDFGNIHVEAGAIIRETAECISNIRRGQPALRTKLEEAERQKEIANTEKRDMEGKMRDMEGKMRDMEGKMRDMEGKMEGKMRDMEGKMRDMEGKMRDMEGKQAEERNKDANRTDDQEIPINLRVHPAVNVQAAIVGIGGRHAGERENDADKTDDQENSLRSEGPSSECENYSCRIEQRCTMCGVRTNCERCVHDM